MTPINCCFWLQGARELCALDTPTPDQIGTIKAHLELAMTHRPPGPLRPREARIIGFLRSLDGALTLGEPDWSKVWSNLSDIFEHVIDPLAIGDQAAMNEAHGMTPRC